MRRRSSLFFSLFLSRENLSSFFNFVSKNFASKSSIRVLRIFLFLQAQGAKEEAKDTDARSHSHRHSSHFFISSRRHTTTNNKNTPHYYYTTTPFTRLFAISHRERESVCVCKRERERKSLSESERVCLFYACGL